jgi:uncharacterized protein (TIGR03437 family)
LFRRLFLPAVLVLALQAQGTGPTYSPDGVLNGATHLPGPLAPNTWTTLQGSNLSWTTASAGPADTAGGQWPIRIPGAGVQVLIGGGAPARLSYVSPTEIHFLTPASQTSGPTTLMVVRNGVVGPAINIVFADVSPGLFQNNSMAIASHADGSAITNDAPAQPGEAIILSATGLGQTAVPLDTQSDGRIVTSTDQTALLIQRFADLQVFLDDTQVDPQFVSWAGLTTGFAGMYQINLQLPDSVGPNPLVRIALGDQSSAPDVHLAVQPAAQP